MCRVQGAWLLISLKACGKKLFGKGPSYCEGPSSCITPHKCEKYTGNIPINQTNVFNKLSKGQIPKTLNLFCLLHFSKMLKNSLN